MKCVECGNGPVTARRENYKYNACGLDYVTLVDIEVRHCDSCGQNEHIIPDVEGLHRVIAHHVARKPSQLVPREIRFLRKYLGLSSADFARAMGKRPETVSRWEKLDAVRPMSLGLERLLRLMVLNERPATYYTPMEIADLGTKTAEPAKLRMSKKPQSWMAEEARAA